MRGSDAVSAATMNNGRDCNIDKSVGAVPRSFLK